MSSHVISLHAGRAGRLGELADQFQARECVTVDFLSAIAAATRPVNSHRTGAARFDRLIGDEAWVDAALALVESELPSWKLRRLAYDEGQWHCALSRQRELPEWLDQAVETGHPDLAMAILRAFIDAVRQDDASRDAGDSIVPRMRSLRDDLMCCDNFA